MNKRKAHTVRKVIVMNIESVKDVYGRNLEIDAETRKLYSFSNKDEKIVYNAEIVENGKKTGFYTDYAVSGKVESIEEKLKQWNNALLYCYASAVNFRASENDPDKEIYSKFVKFVKENEDAFFTKTGDFRKKFLIDEKTIKSAIN